LKIKVEVDLSYRAVSPCTLLLQIEAAKSKRQKVLEADLHIWPEQKMHRYTGEDEIGQRIWLDVSDRFNCTYKALVELDRQEVRLEEIEQGCLSALQGNVVNYLMPSRYCHLERFQDAMPDKFSHLTGGKLVVALAEWIKSDFVYDITASNASTTAHETFMSRRGVCRDYSHVLIALLRSVGIPARMASGYAPSVSPQDFHAVVQVYLDSGWYMIDPTGMTVPQEFVVIRVGRDAADISFLTSFGTLEFESQSVKVEKAVGMLL